MKKYRFFVGYEYLHKLRLHKALWLFIVNCNDYFCLPYFLDNKPHKMMVKKEYKPPYSE